MASELAFDPQLGGKSQTRAIDLAIAALADRQHGVVGRRQLLGLGVGRRAIDTRLAARRLRPLHPGVYAVGHRVLTPTGRLLAAVLSGGPGALLSHRSAAQLWGMRRAGPSAVEVTLPAPRRGRRGVRFHSARIPDDERAVVAGVPVTGVSRTLLDLAAVADRDTVERAANRAEMLGHADPISLEALLARYPGRRGSATIRVLIGERRLGAEVTRSELEDRFLAFCRHHELPQPRANALVEGLEVDCSWPNARLVVELDGHAAHATPGAYETDRARDRALQAAGWRVVRITWRQLHDDPATVATQLRRLLAAPHYPLRPMVSTNQF